jgi:hypothetical protein
MLVAVRHLLIRETCSVNHPMSATRKHVPQDRFTVKRYRIREVSKCKVKMMILKQIICILVIKKINLGYQTWWKIMNTSIKSKILKCRITKVGYNIINNHRIAKTGNEVIVMVMAIVCESSKTMFINIYNLGQFQHKNR